MVQREVFSMQSAGLFSQLQALAGMTSLVGKACGFCHVSVSKQAFTKHPTTPQDLTEGIKAHFGGLVQIVNLMSYDSPLSW